MESWDVTSQMKNFGTFVTTEELPSVLADSTPVLVGVFLRFSCLFRLRLLRQLRLLRFHGFGFGSRRCCFRGPHLLLLRLRLCPCAAVGEAGAYCQFHLKKKINPFFLLLLRQKCFKYSVHVIVCFKTKASSGLSNSLTKWTSSSSSGSSLMTMTGPGEVFLRRLAVGADGFSKLGFQDVL